MLSVRAYPGIAEVCNIIDRWHVREADLLNLHRGLEDYAVLHHADVKTLHSRTLVFAQTSPWIFGIAWLLMAVMAILFVGAGRKLHNLSGVCRSKNTEP